MLNLSLLNDLNFSARMGELAYHADILNCDSAVRCEDIEREFWRASKVFHQSDIIWSAIHSIQRKLTDFRDGNFDQYMDDYCRWASEDDPEFDPYGELHVSIKGTESIYDLPADIATYKELVEFSYSHSTRQRIQNQSFKDLYNGLVFPELLNDSDGGAVFITERELPENVRAIAELNTEIKNIEVEHCLDNYNAWYATMVTMIQERKPFSDMIALIKPG